MNDNHVSILGIDFTVTTMNEMTERLREHIARSEKAFVITANPEIVMKAQESEKFRNITKQASYVVADGIGVVKAAKMLGRPLPERVTGFDLTVKLLNILNEENRTLYMLGAKDEVLQQAINNVQAQYPNIQIVGSHHGYFDIQDDAIPQEIAEKQPDLTLVALGCPRQEEWISTHYDKFQKGVFIGVGGTFDVLAGAVERAPEVWQKLNLEWLYRLLKQPSRWRRMLALPRFVLKVLQQKRNLAR